jgi:xylulokinase
MKYFLGLDVGTSSTKVILIDEKGRVVATDAPEYAFQTPRPRWAEANPRTGGSPRLPASAVCF